MRKRLRVALECLDPRVLRLLTTHERYSTRQFINFLIKEICSRCRKEDERISFAKPMP